MIQTFADWLVYGVFGLDSATKIGQAINFFFYDSRLTCKVPCLSYPKIL